MPPDTNKVEYGILRNAEYVTEPLNKISPSYKQEIENVILQLQYNPHPPGATKYIEGKPPVYRLTASHPYYIEYAVDEKKTMVMVLSIAQSP